MLTSFLMTSSSSESFVDQASNEKRTVARQIKHARNKEALLGRLVCRQFRRSRLRVWGNSLVIMASDVVQTHEYCNCKQ